MSNTVRLASTGQMFETALDETILAGAMRAGIRLPHECTFGGCGTCRVKVEEGAVRYDEFPMALSQEEHDQGFALACQARAVGDVLIEPVAKGMEFAAPVSAAARVVAVRPLTTDITRLVLSLPDDAPLAYRPGQYMRIWLDDGSSRSFSMASAVLPDSQVDFHIRRIDGGHFTSDVLRRLSPGNTLNVELPLGTFCYHKDDWRPMILAATGTGIAPMKAMLEALLDDPDCPPTTLYWGMRTQADLYLKEEIELWKDRLYDFNFIPVLSRADEAWQGRRGHVQDAIVADHDDLSEHAIYLCGAPDMIQQAKAAVSTRGAQLDYLYSDSFTFQHPAALPA